MHLLHGLVSQLRGIPLALERMAHTVFYRDNIDALIPAPFGHMDILIAAALQKLSAELLKVVAIHGVYDGHCSIQLFIPGGRECWFF